MEASQKIRNVRGNTTINFIRNKKDYKPVL